jgi:hypothetical protein
MTVSAFDKSRDDRSDGAHSAYEVDIRHCLNPIGIPLGRAHWPIDSGEVNQAIDLAHSCGGCLDALAARHVDGHDVGFARQYLSQIT